MHKLFVNCSLLPDCKKCVQERIKRSDGEEGYKSEGIMCANITGYHEFVLYSAKKEAKRNAP